MNVQAYLHDDRLRPLLRYLDPDLPDTQRMALLAVAAGFSPKQFHVLPGLGHPSRTKRALRELEAAGRIRRHQRRGWDAVPWPAATQADVEKCLKRSKKVRIALDLLADPAEGLRARGLGHLGTMLGETLSAALDVLLRRVDNAMKWDQQVRTGTVSLSSRSSSAGCRETMLTVWPAPATLRLPPKTFSR